MTPRGRAAVAALAALAAFAAPARAGVRCVSRSVPAMGTMVSATVEASGAPALDAAFARLRELEGRFSAYRADSELSAVNRRRGGTLSPEMARLVARSIEISRATGGAFDITCAPLLDLWREAGRRGAVPSPAELARARARVGWRGMALSGRSLRLASGMKLDLGGIAVGFVVDEMAALLRRAGVRNGLVDGGGEILCWGRGPEGPWRVGVRDPRRKDGILMVISPGGRAVSTSGDYERFVRIGRRRFGGIVDPRTGLTVQDFPAGVTVVAPDCATADALSTGCAVLGAAAVPLLESMDGVEGLLVNADSSRAATRGFLSLALP